MTIMTSLPSRRSWLLMLIGASAAACAGPSPSPSAPPASAPSTAATPPMTGATQAPAAAPVTGPAGKIIFGMETPTNRTIDPGVAQAGQTARFNWPVFDGLTRIDNQGKVRPSLATEWKNTSDKVWEFKLGDYSFQNGRPVEMQDVVESFARYRDPANKLPMAGILLSIDKVEAADAKTLRLTTKVPDPIVPNLLALPTILPMKELAQQGVDAFFRAPFGSGPFRVTKIDFPNGITYSAMDAGFRTPRGPANVRDLDFRFIPEAAARAAAIQTSEVDVAFPLSVDQIPTLERAGFKVVRDPTTTTVSFLLDPTSGPTRDLRVRQAINYGVDKETLVQQLLGGYGRIDGQLLGPGVLGFNPDLKPYPYDLNKAKQLLADAGVSSGLTLPIIGVNSSIGDKTVVEAIAGQLQKLGIQTNAEIREPAVWAKGNSGERDQRRGIWWQGLNWEQTFEAASPWRWLSFDLQPDTGRRWDDETFDKMYQQAKLTFDPVRREQLYREAGKYLHEQAPALFLWQVNRLGVAQSDVTWNPLYVADSFVSLLKRG